MLIPRNDIKEDAEIESLISSDENLRRQHELFLAEMAFKQSLIDARKNFPLSQKELSAKSGLSQQAVSRLEKKGGGTIETLLRYLYSMGYTLSIQKIKQSD